MQRDPRVFLDDILDAIAKIRGYVAGLSLDRFRSDPKSIDAVVRNLEVIGEAAKPIPESVRSSEPGIDWKKIAGFRDVLAHAYFAVDEEIVWDVVQNKLADLEVAIRRLTERS